MSHMLTISLPSEAETAAFGQMLAKPLRPGDVVTLLGPLGAGKTRLAKAIAAAFGVPDEVVNSPTFTLIQEYAGDIPIRHCDVYRLKSPAEFPDLGLDDLFSPEGIALIEWADRVAEFLPEDRLEIRLEAVGVNERQATLVGYGARGIAIAETIAAATWPAVGDGGNASAKRRENQ
jgi:tRNA threonylcarbamoyladenosine biosynthesis protein TsaE